METHEALHTRYETRIERPGPPSRRNGHRWNFSGRDRFGFAEYRRQERPGERVGRRKVVRAGIGPRSRYFLSACNTSSESTNYLDRGDEFSDEFRENIRHSPATSDSLSVEITKPWLWLKSPDCGARRDNWTKWRGNWNGQLSHGSAVESEDGLMYFLIQGRILFGTLNRVMFSY